MRPVLALHEDGREHTPSEIREVVATQFQLTPEDREERLPSGAARTFDNRIGWATTYLARTGLLIRPRRAITTITDRGRTVLIENPERVDLNVLSQFPEFDEFRTSRGGRRTTRSGEHEVTRPGVGDTTPEEAIESAYGELRAALAGETLSRVLTRDDQFFEDLVLDLLLKMGYGGSRQDASERLGRTGDGGVDGVIREDRLGLDVIYVQAKRWDPSGRPIRRPDIQAFVGALQGVRASKGVFITTSRFTTEAREYIDRVQARVVLIDGRELAELMIDHDVGVSGTGHSYELKRIDEDYFVEDDGTSPAPTKDASPEVTSDANAPGLQE
jgi:restriction system protein